ncbi:hypothetical protein Cob_v001682 [Colletotrichum orbiculare MAFF 240422]|uniref:Uncharacterized protein n=1 Tax=Colletotrichum orbiculare (strain 104-T / ATCC 96160 / CBS 514.97 / LARS 414 / MAFF 240422) TaxID=1213857 RepID=A0A484G708_COLOR|nr:hypothetical protein Cob_v001682 [Colletotrichum orbiculare MAFF 240422]
MRVEASLNSITKKVLTMKFFTVVVVAVASVAMAAPSPEAKSAAVKVSQDTIDAITAAYPGALDTDCSFDFSCGCIYCW